MSNFCQLLNGYLKISSTDRTIVYDCPNVLSYIYLKTVSEAELLHKSHRGTSKEVSISVISHIRDAKRLSNFTFHSRYRRDRYFIGG